MARLLPRKRVAEAIICPMCIYCAFEKTTSGSLCPMGSQVLRYLSVCFPCPLPTPLQIIPLLKAPQITQVECAICSLPGH